MGLTLIQLLLDLTEVISMMRFLVTEKEHFHLTLIGVVFTSESIFTPMENHLVLVYQGEPSKTRGHF